MGGEVGANLQKVFAYGIRNSFGMAFDPKRGSLWTHENGEDAFDEINLVEPGFNGGWIQIMGPVERVAEFKQIETTSLHHDDFPNLQQFRWGPERIADTPDQALERLFAARGFGVHRPPVQLEARARPGRHWLPGRQGARAALPREPLRGVLDPRHPQAGRCSPSGSVTTSSTCATRGSEDKVADNVTFHDMTESESLLFGQNFGIVTDIHTGPNGNLFVVSLSDGAIYEIFRRS